MCRWPDGGINGFPCGVLPLQHHRIIPVTEHRRQGDNALTGCCGRSGFSLAGAVQVTVGGEDNLTGRVFLTGQARQRKKVHGRQRHHDGFSGQVMHGKGSRIALRYPQAFSRLFLSVDKMACAFDLPALQGAFKTVSINKLEVNQRAGPVIQRHYHITGAVGHAAGFVRRGQRQTLTTCEALAGQVGVAGGRAGFLQQSDGQRGRRFAVGLRSGVCGCNHLRGYRRQVAGDGVHLPGGLRCRYAEHLLNQFQAVTGAAPVAVPCAAPFLVIKAKAVTTGITATNRAGLMAVFYHFHSQRRENARPVAARLFYGVRYVHFHGFLPQCSTGDVIWRAQSSSITASPRKDSDGAAFSGPASIKSSSNAQAIRRPFSSPCWRR